MRSEAPARPRRHPLSRETALGLGAVCLVAAVAWAGLIFPAPSSEQPTMSGMDSMPGMQGMPQADAPGLGGAVAAVGSAVGFVSAWVVMMTAMMLPSSAPIVTLSHRMARGGPWIRVVQASGVVVGYLAIWALFGLGVHLLWEALTMIATRLPLPAQSWPWLVASTLGAAGAYQFSSLKDRCLGQCRSPFSFVLTRWRGGLRGSIRLGVEHGIYCVGCCWALMLVLVVAGGMGLAWVALIALVVFVEKLLPRGRIAARAVGIALLALAIGVLVRPELASQLPM